MRITWCWRTRRRSRGWPARTTPPAVPCPASREWPARERTGMATVRTVVSTQSLPGDRPAIPSRWSSVRGGDVEAFRVHGGKKRCSAVRDAASPRRHDDPDDPNREARRRPAASCRGGSLRAAVGPRSGSRSGRHVASRPGGCALPGQVVARRPKPGPDRAGHVPHVVATASSMPGGGSAVGRAPTSHACRRVVPRPPWPEARS